MKYIILLLACAGLASAQSTRVATVSAYEVTGDSTTLFTFSAPFVMHDIVVIIDTAWGYSDSLKIGTSGLLAQRPGNLLSTDSTGRHVAAGKRVYIGQSISGLNGSVTLYHPNPTGPITGRVIVYFRWTDIAAAPGTVTFTTLE